VKSIANLMLAADLLLMAASAAQAADLPINAKAIQYVKTCSLYGAGFYSIPGTDTCIKLGDGYASSRRLRPMSIF
jgi:hypothetical protein